MSEAGPRRELTLLDAACVVVGIVIGVGIYEVPPLVASAVPGTAGVLGLWALGGALSLAGALCYAELASAYPQAGGDVVYLGRAYGSGAGFLFGWAELSILRPGMIVQTAFVLAGYAAPLGAGPADDPRWAAAGAVVLLTAVNVAGVRQGKWVQNLLTAVKVAGLGAVLAAALLAAGPSGPPPSPPPEWSAGGVGLALILVLFTFGGWNELGYLGAELKDPGRTAARALIGGMLGVSVLYLLVNLAFLRALGPAGLSASKVPAVDALPAWAGRAVAVLVCLSALGAMNGLILTGSRISYALGAGGSGVAWLGRWDPRRGTPARALLLQGAVSLALIAALGSFRDSLLYTTPVVFSFFLATGASVLILRRKEPEIPRPFRAPGGPVLPLLFCLTSAFLVVSAVDYSLDQGLAGPLVALGIALAGVPIWLLGRRRRGP